MNYEDLKDRLGLADLSAEEIFVVIRSVAYYYMNPNNEKSKALDLIVRMIEKRSHFDQIAPGAGTMIFSVAREAGLYPYIMGTQNWQERLVVEAMRAPGLGSFVFHIEQAYAFADLISGYSLILSAPTSFGKSLLVDALISYKRPKTVVAVVPTIALLDETRRRLEERFADYQVLTRPTEARDEGNAIFVGTQERLLERSDIDGIDLFVIDEFYKLDLERSDRRSLALNAILAKYGKKAKQIYLLGPSIDEVPNLEVFRPDLKFLKTKYSPVTADIIDRTEVGASIEQLISDLKSTGRSSSLIYVQSPPSSYRLAEGILKSRLSRKSAFCSAFATWIADNYHPEWALVECVERGIGIHHGRIPRSLAHLLISLFNSGEIAVIICTSSMIEGINTVAENVFIYDGHISTSKLDRFTFDNIKGRAGRMFQHLVGKIFVYNAPPDPGLFDVNVPIFNQDEIVEPELLVKIDDENLSDLALTRKRSISGASELSGKLLAEWSEFGVDELNRLAQILRERIREPNSLLEWSGLPSFEQLEATFSVSWGVLRYSKHGSKSARQAAFFANRLRVSGSLKQFLAGLVQSTGLTAQAEIDRCFNFIRGAEYTFPQVLRATNDILDEVYDVGKVEYRVYAAKLQNHFLPGELRALDEYGVPTPIIERLKGMLPIDNIPAARRILRNLPTTFRQQLTDFELDVLLRGLN